MRLIDQLRSRPVERAALVEVTPTYSSDTERVGGSARNAFLQSPTIHAVIRARQKVFSEVAAAWRRHTDRELFTTADLAILERPYPGATLTELLARMELDASLSGNAFVYRPSADRLQVLHPDKVEVQHNQREVTGYKYWPNGVGNGSPRALLRDDVAHWAPIPHPDKAFIGVGWVQAVIPEIRADLKMVRHQERFFDHAATPNMIITLEGKLTDPSRDRLRTELERRYAGIQNAYKTLVLDGGAKVTPAGSTFEQMDFVNIQESVEARIASAGGVPPIVVSFKAGLKSSTYSNYGLAMRAFADHTIRPNWNSVFAALGSIVPAPGGSELWYDDRHVAALQQDQLDAANVLEKQAATIGALITAGFEPDSASKGVTAGDLSNLKHTGLVSVQLHDPAAAPPPAAPTTEEPPPATATDEGTTQNDA